MPPRLTPRLHRAARVSALVVSLATIAAVLAGCAHVPDPTAPPPEPRSVPAPVPAPAPAPLPTPLPAPPPPLPTPAPEPPTRLPLPAPPPALPVVDANEVRALALRALPARLLQRNRWADDIATSFVALSIPALPHKVCALAAVVEQESTWQADPPVANLAAIARRELDRKRERFGIPGPVFELALLKVSPNDKSYRERLDRLRTERELSDLFEDMIREIPFGVRLFDGQNPVRTGGSTQVSIAFADQQLREARYPWAPHGSAREEVFTRRGGLYFGAAMLLDYPVSYQRMRSRFADYNAGRYASRNAAVQALLAQLTGQRIALDGDLLRYRGSEPLPVRTDPSQAWRALTALHGLDLAPAQIERDLRLEKRFEFEQSPTYLRLHALATQRGLQPERERVPDIELNSPKISRKLTTAWFADRCEQRYRACLARVSGASPLPGDDAR